MMSSRLDKSWIVLASHQIDEGNRCVDIFSGPTEPSGSRSSAEILRTWAAWTPVSYFSGREYSTESEAVVEVIRLVSWLGPLLDR